METTSTTTTTAPRKTGRKVERISLKAICKELRVEPKAARRKLRKASGLSFHGSRERWVFTEAQAARAKEILRPDLAEKAAKKAAKAVDQPTAQ